MTVPRKTLNLWPFAIIGFFVVFIAATVGLVFFSTLHHMDLVSEDYYEREVDFQDQLDRMKRTHALQRGVTVKYDSSKNSILLEFPPEHVRKHAEGTIHLYRPSQARLDQRIAVDYDGNGRQVVHTESLRSGLWKIRILWTLDDQEYFHDQSVFIHPGAAS